MPPRDQTDYEQRREQIIAGALEVFARKGLERATNKDIAEAAGIGSAGLIYHYFASKDDLFRQVLAHYAPLMPLLAQIDTFMDMPPRETLTLFGRTFLSVVDNPALISFFRMTISEISQHPALHDALNQIGPGRWFPIIERYLQRQMDLGVLRQSNPTAAARCFAGPFVAYVLAYGVFDPHQSTPPLPPEIMIETAVDIFLQGLEQQSEEA